MSLTCWYCCATILNVQKITFINNDGEVQTVEAYEITGDNNKDIPGLFHMFPERDVFVVPGGAGSLTIKTHDADGFEVQSFATSKGNFVYRDSKNLPAVVFPFMLVKDAPGLIRSLWDHSNVGFSTGMEFAKQWLHTQKQTLEHPQKTPEVQDSWLAVYEVGEHWDESDWEPLEEFLGKSAGSTPLIAITSTKKNLKSIVISDYRFGGTATVFPNDVIIKYNGKFAIIRNGVRFENKPFVD